MKTKYSLLLFILCCLALYSCKTKEHVYNESSETKKNKRYDLTIGKYNKLLKNGTPQAKYDAAVKYFEKENYTKALTLFEELMNVYKGTAKAEEVNYYYAYCHYNLGDYLIAGYQFRTYVKNFPGSKHTEECAYMNAYCFSLNSPEYSLDQVDTKLAIKEFQRFINQYPTSDRIPKCNEILDGLRAKLERKSYENAMLYYKMDDYKAAIVVFADHIKEFPGTEHVEELNYLTIRSYYLLALNSIESKKQERFKLATDSYLKFVDTYPKSKYLKQAELIYSSALINLEKYTTNKI